MKKVLLSVFLFLTLFCFTGCQNFLGGSSTKSELDKKIEYENEKEHLEVIKFSPVNSDSGIYEAAPIAVTFNKAVKTDTLNYKITSSGNDLKNYYNEPLFTENDSKIIIYPVTEKSILSDQNELTQMEIDFEVLETTRAVDGSHLLKESKIYSFKINNKTETEPPVLSRINFARTKADIQNKNYLTTEKNEEENKNVYLNAVSLWIDCTGYDTGSGIKALLIKETLLKNDSGTELNAFVKTDSNGYGTGSFELTSEGVGYSNGVFEYKFGSLFDGIVELEIKPVDNCGNIGEATIVYVYKDTIVNFGNGVDISIKNDSCFKITKNPDDGQYIARDFKKRTSERENVFYFNRELTDVYYNGKKTSGLSYTVKYGHNNLDLKELSPEGYLQLTETGIAEFKIDDLDRSQNTYIYATVTDKAGNSIVITALVPEEDKYYGFFEGSKNSYEGTEGKYYIKAKYITDDDNRFIIKQFVHYSFAPKSDPDDKSFYSFLLDGTYGSHNFTFDADEFENYVEEIYIATVVSYIKSPLITDNSVPTITYFSGPYDVETSVFSNNTEKKDLDFTYTFYPDVLGSNKTSVELKAKDENLSFDEMYFSFKCQMCQEIKKYNNSSITFDFKTIYNAGDYTDKEYNNDYIYITFYGLKDGKLFQNTKQINKETLKPNHLYNSVYFDDYGQTVRYMCGAPCNKFKVENNKIKARLYYCALTPELKALYVSGTTNNSTVLGKRLLSKEEIRKLPYSDCVIENKNDTPAVFEFKMNDITEGDYMLFMEFVDSNEKEYCNTLSPLKYHYSGKKPVVTIKDTQTADIVYEKKSTEGHVPYFIVEKLNSDNKWTKVVDNKKFHQSSARTYSYSNIQGLKNEFFRVYCEELMNRSQSPNTQDLEKIATLTTAIPSYYGSYFSDIVYASGFAEAERCSGSLSPVCGGYTALSKNKCLLQTYYSSKNYGSSVEDWEKYCLPSQKINPKVMEPFITYNVDTTDIPAGSYYVTIAYFTDGSSAISDVQYK